MNKIFFIFSIVLYGFIGGASAATVSLCGKALGDVGIVLVPPDVVELKVQLPDVQISSLVDPTRSTGATLLFFPRGAAVNFDARGGSVAAVETTLFEEGSYGDNRINGLVFAGGSTMGLAATDGVREVLFRKNIDHSTDFDFIPSVPGAVVYDYGGRIFPFNDPTVYPNNAFGMELTKHLSTDTFYMGRTGAGISTTVNKIGVPYWGGQGAAFGEYSWGKLLAVVVLNSSGDIKKNGVSLAPHPTQTGKRSVRGQNTTLSAIITDVKLDRSQLKRLAIMVHTNMAQMIDPFHTPEDGDIHFALSTGNRLVHSDDEFSLQQKAIALMRQAIENSVRAANGY
ncbi:MAG: P1 family peptidase [Deltaproteobacteria bacterium]|nr:P1 family peptidase [Deltaproteobacteria bacterium]